MKKTNRQRILEYLKAVKEKPKRGVLIVLKVDENGVIVDDQEQFFADEEHIAPLLEAEVEKRIPPTYLSGWLAGRGIRRQKKP